MCSIAMPAELILHSPPVYSSLLYGPLVVTAPTITSRSVPPRIRPCLSTGSLPLDSLRNNDGKQKKRVVFADDRGRPLTQVRVMSEPSNVPPLWSTAYVAGLLGISKDQSQEATQDITPPWQVTFPQPASDYLAFRRKLDQNNVSLENVIVRESEQCLVGTVKVRNLAYDKEVVVRASSDSWSTHEDVHCTYVAQPGSSSSLILYDTFRFRLTLPVASNVIEFCVRYRTDGRESWDNNEGKNYLVSKKQEVLASASSYDQFMKIIQRLPPAITSATTLANVDIIVARYLLKRSLLPPPFLHSWDFRPVCEQESVLSFHPRLDPNLAGLVISANVIVLKRGGNRRRHCFRDE